MFTDEELRLVELESDRYMVLVVQSAKSKPGLVFEPHGPVLKFQAEPLARRLRNALPRAKVLVWPEYRVRYVMAQRALEGDA